MATKVGGDADVAGVKVYEAFHCMCVCVCVCVCAWDGDPPDIEVEGGIDG